MMSVITQEQLNAAREARNRIPQTIPRTGIMLTEYDRLLAKVPQGSTGDTSQKLKDTRHKYIREKRRLEMAGENEDTRRSKLPKGDTMDPSVDEQPDSGPSVDEQSDSDQSVGEQSDSDPSVGEQSDSDQSVGEQSDSGPVVPGLRSMAGVLILAISAYLRPKEVAELSQVSQRLKVRFVHIEASQIRLLPLDAVEHVQSIGTKHDPVCANLRDLLSLLARFPHLLRLFVQINGKGKGGKRKKFTMGDLLRKITHLQWLDVSIDNTHALKFDAEAIGEDQLNRTTTRVDITCNQRTRLFGQLLWTYQAVREAKISSYYWDVELHAFLNNNAETLVLLELVFASSGRRGGVSTPITINPMLREVIFDMRPFQGQNRDADNDVLPPSVKLNPNSPRERDLSVTFITGYSDVVINTGNAFVAHVEETTKTLYKQMVELCNGVPFELNVRIVDSSGSVYVENGCMG